MEKMIRRSHKSSFKEGDYFPFEVFLIVRYHLYRVKKKHAKGYYTLSLGAYKHISDKTSVKLQESHVLDWVPHHQSLRLRLENEAFIEGWSQEVGVKEQEEWDKKRRKVRTRHVMGVTALGKRAQIHKDLWELSLLIGIYARLCPLWFIFFLKVLILPRCFPPLDNCSLHDFLKVLLRYV